VNFYLQLFTNLQENPGDVDIIELLKFRRKSVLAGDLNAKRLFWNSTVSNPSGKKLLDLFDTSVNSHIFNQPKFVSYNRSCLTDSLPASRNNHYSENVKAVSQVNKVVKGKRTLVTVLWLF
jgi:hypothetical protein